MSARTALVLHARRHSGDPLERYDTPAWITRTLITHGPVTAGRVIEPMAGAGWMSSVLWHDAGCDVAAFDIEPRAEGITQADTLMPGFFEQIALKYGRDIAIITNPPFSKVAAVALRGQMFRQTALLARLSWLEKTRDRVAVPDPQRVIVLPRPQFTGKGSDSVTVAWMCWGDYEPGLVRLSRADCELFNMSSASSAPGTA